MVTSQFAQDNQLTLPEKVYSLSLRYRESSFFIERIETRLSYVCNSKEKTLDRSVARIDKEIV